MMFFEVQRRDSSELPIVNPSRSVSDATMECETLAKTEGWCMVSIVTKYIHDMYISNIKEGIGSHHAVSLSKASPSPVMTLFPLPDSASLNIHIPNTHDYCI